MNSDKQLITSGLKQAKAITKKRAKTFYFASRFLGAKQRNAAYSIYAICRISDDCVDTTQKTPKHKQLAKIHSKINTAYSCKDKKDPIFCAFSETINTYNIPKQYFDILLSGMVMDIYKTRYNNFRELYNYCYRAAGVVGLILLSIFGYKDIKAKKYAVDLGIAMQLTNILRDIDEDLQRGRIYLPKEEMALYGVTEKNLKENTLSNKFKKLMEFQISRARYYYNLANSGIKLIKDSRAGLVAAIMKNIYSEILTAIERNDYDIFSQRAHVKLPRKISMLIKTITRSK